MPPQIGERVHIFNTFFYSRLVKRAQAARTGNPIGKPKKSSEEEQLYHQALREKYHNKVSKWTKTVDIFSKEFIFIPILKKYHWLLAVICFAGQEPVIEVQQDDDSISYKAGIGQPCILVFDSLNQTSSRTNIIYPIRYFLEREWQLKKQGERSFQKPLVPEYFPITPTQPNHYDCGLFVMEYVERLIAAPELVLTDNCINTNLRDWFNVNQMLHKRDRLVKLILSLSDSMRMEDLRQLRALQFNERAERLAKRRLNAAANLEKHHKKRQKKRTKRKKRQSSALDVGKRCKNTEMIEIQNANLSEDTEVECNNEDEDLIEVDSDSKLDSVHKNSENEKK